MNALKAFVVAILLWLRGAAVGSSVFWMFPPPQTEPVQVAPIQLPPIQLTPIASELSSPTFVTLAGRRDQPPLHRAKPAPAAHFASANDERYSRLRSLELCRTGGTKHRDARTTGSDEIMTDTYDEAKRTAPLAFWRYAHDYLRAASSLCHGNRTLCIESQVPYHIVAQGLEFALHAYLRAMGVTTTEIRARLGHSLDKAMALCEAHGMPPLPAHWQPAFRDLAACHTDRGFEYFVAAEDAYAEISPLVDAGVWILGHVAPIVADHYVRNLGIDGSPSAREFVRSLRAALSAMADTRAHRPG